MRHDRNLLQRTKCPMTAGVYMDYANYQRQCSHAECDARTASSAVYCPDTDRKTNSRGHRRISRYSRVDMNYELALLTIKHEEDSVAWSLVGVTHIADHMVSTTAARAASTKHVT